MPLNSRDVKVRLNISSNMCDISRKWLVTLDFMQVELVMESATVTSDEDSIRLVV